MCVQKGTGSAFRVWSRLLFLHTPTALSLSPRTSYPHTTLVQPFV